MEGGRTSHSKHNSKGRPQQPQADSTAKGRRKETPEEESRSKERILSLQRQNDNDVCCEGEERVLIYSLGWG
jgi:hypothetical protein